MSTLGGQTPVESVAASDTDPVLPLPFSYERSDRKQADILATMPGACDVKSVFREELEESFSSDVLCL